MNKRGLSDIVTNVLIILLVLVAVGIIWAFLQPTISSGAGQLENAALLSVSLNIVNYDTSTQGQVNNLVVRRGAGEGDVIGFNVVLEDVDGNTYVYKRDVVLDELASDSVPPIDYSGEIGELAKISVAPIISTPSGDELSGGIIDSVSVSSDGVVPVSCSLGDIRNIGCDANGLTSGSGEYCDGGGNWGSCVCYADANGDGIIDSSDQTAILNNNAPCYDCDGNGIQECGGTSPDFLPDTLCMINVYVGFSTGGCDCRVWDDSLNGGSGGWDFSTC